MGIEDRRGYTRIESSAKVVVDLAGQRPVLGKLIDLGLGGVRLEAPLKLAAGDRVELRSVSDSALDSLSFRVVWASQNDTWSDAGLAFEGTATEFLQSWVSQLFCRFGGDIDQMLERRRYIRLPLEAPLELRLQDRRWPANLLDIGGGGVLLSSQADLPVGRYAEVFLSVPGLLLDGTVVQKRREGENWLYSLNFTPHSEEEPALKEYLKGL